MTNPKQWWISPDIEDGSMSWFGLSSDEVTDIFKIGATHVVSMELVRPLIEACIAERNGLNLWNAIHDEENISDTWGSRLQAAARASLEGQQLKELALAEIEKELEE